MNNIFYYIYTIICLITIWNKINKIVGFVLTEEILMRNKL